MARTLIRFAVLLTLSISIITSYTMQAQGQSPQAATKPTFIPPSQRLANAKTAYVRNGGGSSIPFDVINNSFDGWPRFVVVDSPEKADIIVEVTSPEDIKSSTTTGSHISASGMPEQTTTTSREIGSDRVKMIVQDAKSHITLWAASQQAKSAMKQRAYNDNLVEAAQKLMTQFHDRVEPAAAK